MGEILEYIAAAVIALIILIPVGFVIWWIIRFLFALFFPGKEVRAALAEEKQKIAEREARVQTIIRKYSKVKDMDQLPSDIDELRVLLDHHRENGPPSSTLRCAERMIQLGYSDGHYYMARRLSRPGAPVEELAKAMHHLRKSLPDQFPATDQLLKTIPAELYKKHIDDRNRLFVYHTPLELEIPLTAGEAFDRGNQLALTAATYRQCDEAEAYLLYAAKEGFDQKQVDEALARATGRKHYLFGLQCLEEGDLKESSRQLGECLRVLPLYEEVFEAAKSMASEAVTTNECEYVRPLLVTLNRFFASHKKDKPNYRNLFLQTLALIDSTVPRFHAYKWPHWMDP